MQTHSTPNQSQAKAYSHPIFWLELLCLAAVSLLLACVVTQSGTLTSSSHGGLYMFAMLGGISALMLSMALLLEQLKEREYRFFARD